MSTINTNPINVNYPVPGINNNSQGFRDNFASIVTNLNAAGVEITDLQNKVVVKQALIGTTINNDMANTLISNASTRSFRATTYNLGNAIVGTVLVNVSLGDVQYGTVAGNTTINFGSWAPSGTQSNVQVNLSIAANAANAVISFPSSVTLSPDTGATTLENYSNIAGNLAVTVPNGVSQLNYLVSTTDCGNTLYITPINRPRQATQVQQRLVPPTGFQGDVPGDVAVSPSVNQLTITGANTDPYLTTSGNTAQLYTDLPIVFTGISLAGNIVVGTTYYVRNVVSGNTFTVSSSIGGANIAIGANASGTTMLANPAAYVYVATDTYNSTACVSSVTNTFTSTNLITLSGNLSSLTSAVNAPIIFTANMGGLVSDTVYYIKTVSSPNITVSQSRTNGVADSTVVLSSNTVATSATYFVGNDIWKRIALANW
jgi:hypothetical protein